MLGGGGVVVVDFTRLPVQVEALTQDTSRALAGTVALMIVVGAKLVR
jgi:hypothetical protein